jgi:hypothetical protein
LPHQQIQQRPYWKDSIAVPETVKTGTLEATVPNPPRRPAWVEIDLAQLRRNFQTINSDKPPKLQLLSVLKDEGYGHGALRFQGLQWSAGYGFSVCPLSMKLSPCVKKGLKSLFCCWEIGQNLSCPGALLTI